MGLPNIHGVRSSFIQLRTLINSPELNGVHFQQLHSTLWIHHIASLFLAVDRCVISLCNEGNFFLMFRQLQIDISEQNN